MAKKDINPDFEENMKSILIENIRNLSNTKKLIDVGVTFLYLYKDKDEIDVCEIEISPKDL